MLASRIHYLGLPTIRNGLVGWWPLNDGAGTIAYDKSGNGCNGTLMNMESGDWVTTTKRPGGGLDFGGTDEYVGSVGTASSYSFVQNTSLFSLMAWINLASVTSDTLSSICGNTPIATLDKGFSFYYENRVAASSPRRLTFISVRGVSGVRRLQVLGSYGTLSTGWHHVACLANGSSGQLYIDGVTDSTAQAVTNTAPSGDSSMALMIGAMAYASAPGYLFTLLGKLSDVRLYNRELSVTELKAIYTGNG
jgi:hypothetical protein